MSQLVRLEGKHTGQCTHCALYSIRCAIATGYFKESTKGPIRTNLIGITLLAQWKNFNLESGTLTNSQLLCTKIINFNRFDSYHIIPATTILSKCHPRPQERLQPSLGRPPRRSPRATRRRGRARGRSPTQSTSTRYMSWRY